MSVINKELYDALIEAKVSDEKATAAAKSLDQGIKADISDIKVNIAGIEARLALAEKLQWGIILGIVGILIKSFIG